MTNNIFFISDTHFGHQGVCEFLREDGSKLRHWNTAAEMDEELVKNWNEVVRPCDKVYHLGDVAMSHQSLKILERLNGKKVLIKGNHDIYKLKDYTPYFKDIRAYHVMDKIIYSHIPVHPDSKGRFRANVHGHLHARRVMREELAITSAAENDVEYNPQTRTFESISPPTLEISTTKIIDPFYFCVSVENIDYRPISYEDLLTQL